MQLPLQAQHPALSVGGGGFGCPKRGVAGRKQPPQNPPVERERESSSRGPVLGKRKNTPALRLIVMMMKRVHESGFLLSWCQRPARSCWLCNCTHAAGFACLQQEQRTGKSCGVSPAANAGKAERVALTLDSLIASRVAGARDFLEPRQNRSAIRMKCPKSRLFGAWKIWKRCRSQWEARER